MFVFKNPDSILKQSVENKIENLLTAVLDNNLYYVLHFFFRNSIFL